MSAHASRLSGFFHQLDLSQPIISSFEPWAQSMIALSINACMIYFDGASDDKWLACGCVCLCPCLCAHMQQCALCTNNKWLSVGVYFCTFTQARVLVCLSITIGAYVCACWQCACECVCTSRQGVVNQFRVNWERHVALHRMSFQSHPFIFGLLHNQRNLPAEQLEKFLIISLYYHFCQAQRLNLTPLHLLFLYWSGEEKSFSLTIR